MEESQAAVQSSSSSNLNSTLKDSEEKGTPTTSSVSKTSQRAPSPNPHLPPPSQRKSTSPHPPRSRSRASSRSPARSTHSTSSTTPNPKAIKSQAEGTHKLVEYVDEDGISHWHRQEHVNLHTECGRHGDEWLFGGWSLMGVGG